MNTAEQTSESLNYESYTTFINVAVTPDGTQLLVSSGNHNHVYLYSLNGGIPSEAFTAIDLSNGVSTQGNFIG